MTVKSVLDLESLYYHNCYFDLLLFGEFFTAAEKLSWMLSEK